MVPDDPVGVIISVVVATAIAGIFIKLMSLFIESPVNIESGDLLDQLQMDIVILGIDAIVWLAGGAFMVLISIIGVLLWAQSSR